MFKEIGTEELVYCTITAIVPLANVINIEYRHANGTTQYHVFSLDKDRHQNCYRELEVGCHYIIVTEHTSKHRWIWRKALLVSKKEMADFRSIAGLCPTLEQMQEAMDNLRTKRNPPKSTLNDLLVY